MGVLNDVHGGNLHKLSRSSCCLPSQIVDFSSSINPLGPSLDVLRILRKGIRGIRHYPDPEVHSLVAGLSRRSGLDPSHYLTGNGSVELLYLLPLALQITNALIVGPTFSEYQKSVGIAGGTAIYLMAEAEHDYRPPIWKVLDSIRQAQPRFNAVYVCNPNSPTGQVVNKQHLLDLIAVLEDERVWVIVDESFIDFAPEQSISDAVVRYSRLVVLRSFTKFYGIPGLRVGYLIAQPWIIEQVRRRQPPWSVNILAQTAALAGLRDATYRRKSLSLIAEERPRLSQLLTNLAPIRVFPSAANFVLIELPPRLFAKDVAERLERSCLLVRDCSCIPGLTQRSIRIAVKTPREDDRLISALEGIVRG